MPHRRAERLDERIEEIVERFEEAWHGPWPPRLEAFLPGDAALFWPVLVELVHIDLEYRLKRGEKVTVEAYLRNYPELSDDRATVVDLLAAEFRLRRCRTRDLTPEEFLRRFPSELQERYNEE